jgi:outer membrane protein assembly factor BamB
MPLRNRLAALVAGMGLPLLCNIGLSAPVYFRHDNGAAANTRNLPERFDSTPRWRTPVDSGQSSPTVVGGRIFLTTFNPASQELATVAISATNGAVLWRRVVPASTIEPFHQQSGSGAPCTPASDGERVYAFYGSYGLICYDLNGRQLWEYRMGPFRDEYGAGSSPIVIGDLVVLNQDHDIDSFLIAVNRRTGKLAWKTPRPDAVRSYSTPAVWSHNGQTQLIVAGALEIAGYHPANGERLWSRHGLARIVIPAPIASGDTIYMAAWAPGGDAGARITFPAWTAALERWDTNKDTRLTRAEIDDSNVLERFFRMDLDQTTTLDQKEWERHAEVFQRAENCVLALKPGTARGELSDSAVVWKYTRGVPYVPSPLLDNGMFWMVKDGGIVTKLDAATGRMLQEERLGAGGQYLASPVAGDGKIFFCSVQGAITVVANHRDWRILSSHLLREKISATPALHGDRIYLRTDQALYSF